MATAVEKPSAELQLGSANKSTSEQMIKRSCRMPSSMGGYAKILTANKVR